MNKKTIITALLALVAMAGQAQTKVTGHVVNERGEKVEYVSIGIEEDSVGVISDAQGHFALTIPAGRRDELTFTHVSYQTATIPYTTYADGHELSFRKSAHSFTSQSRISSALSRTCHSRISLLPSTRICGSMTLPFPSLPSSVTDLPVLT